MTMSMQFAERFMLLLLWGTCERGNQVRDTCPPQVKSWTRGGDPISSSGHNHAPVQCLLPVPDAAPARGGAVWCGAGDGALSMWRDQDGGGRLEQGWQFVKPEGQRGAHAWAAVLA
jgi:hypothetical protein